MTWQGVPTTTYSYLVQEENIAGLATHQQKKQADFLGMMCMVASYIETMEILTSGVILIST
jgi:hypothetical protein